MTRAAALPEIDVLLHEPARLRVLTLLAMVESADFMYLLRHSGLTRGNLSVQMSRLEQGRVVRLERRLHGTRHRTTYFLSDEGRRALGEYKRAMTSLLDPIPD